MRCERLAAGPYNAKSTPMLMTGSEIGFGVDVHGINIISLAARLRMAMLTDGLAKMQAAHNSVLVTSPSCIFDGMERNNAASRHGERHDESP